ncbi:MAG TPA: hypothetical protein VIH18_34710 [Candidatus Binatia bacterium]|jgi:putative ABC transport system substrate-binding protein
MKRLGIDRFNLSFKSAIRNPKSAILLCALLFAIGAPAEAQQAGRVYRIGILQSASSEATFIEGFRRGLRELGYIEGKNLALLKFAGAR